MERDKLGRFVKKYNGGGVTNTSSTADWFKDMFNSQYMLKWLDTFNTTNYLQFNDLLRSWKKNQIANNYYLPGLKSTLYTLGVYDRLGEWEKTGTNLTIEDLVNRGVIKRVGNTGDNIGGNHQDGYFGELEWLRHGGNTDTWVGHEKELLDFLNKLKERGLTYTVNLDTGMYELGLLNLPVSNNTLEEPSKASGITGNVSGFKDNLQTNKPTFKTTFGPKLMANVLEASRLIKGLNVNNKIAERALDAEKPYLIDPLEHRRNVYGNLRAMIEGLLAAGALRNLASKPITSDANLQMAARLEAENKAQQYILQGNLQDDNMIRQTSELAWQLEKENKANRHDVAMLNRLSMLKTQLNIANIKNIRDSANYSQVIAPWLGGWELRLRNKAAELEAYQEKYDYALANLQELYEPGFERTEDEERLRKAYLADPSGFVRGLTEGSDDYNTWLNFQRKLQQGVLRRQAAIHGVNIPNLAILENPYLRGQSEERFKKGGQIYSAKLRKRTRDNDRASKDINESKRESAKSIRLAVDKLYRYPKEYKRKRKYQAGGGLPFVNFSPVFATSEKGTPTTTETAKKGEDLTTKDLLNLLKEEALPSDMNAVVSTLLNFEIESKLDPLSSTSDIASRYLSTLRLINNAKFNRKEYDSAFKLLTESGAINELAITSEGYLIGVNKDGDFKYFSPTDNVSEGYLLLTNSNLLNLRANSPATAFDSKLLNVALSGISMNDVTKMILTTILDLGSISSSESGYTSSKAGKLIRGINDFNRASAEASNLEDFNGTLQDLYKYKYLSKDLALQAMQSILYVWKTLPNNAKTLLISNTQNRTEKEAFELVLQLINSKTSSTTEFSLDLEGGKSAKSTKKGDSTDSGSDLDKFKLDPVSMLQAGYGLKLTIKILTAGGANNAIEVPTVRMPITAGGKGIGANATLSDVSSSDFTGYLDFENASMGDLMISTNGFSNIAVNGTALYTGYLPIDILEYNTTGNIKPDILLLTRYKEALQYIADNDITDKNQINAVYQNYKLPILYGENGDVLANYHKFGMINATALSKAFDEDVDLSPMLSETLDENEINNTLTSLLKGRGDKDRIDFQEKGLFNSIWGGYDKVYKGTVFIPVNEDFFTGTGGSGSYPTNIQALMIDALLRMALQAEAALAAYVNPGRL